jgi:hypothetical protein
MTPSLHRGRGLAAPGSCKDDDTGLGYYDTPTGDIWRPAKPVGRACGDAPRRPTTRPSSPTTTCPEPELMARTGSLAT